MYMCVYLASLHRKWGSRFRSTSQKKSPTRTSTTSSSSSSSNSSGAPSTSMTADASSTVGGSHSNGNSSSPFKVKFLVPSLELVVTKTSMPYPSLDVHLQGMALMKLPMSDETLCHYLAWTLSELMPIYF